MEQINKKAFHDYEVLEKYEVGIVLEGSGNEIIGSKKNDLNIGRNIIFTDAGGSSGSNDKDRAYKIGLYHPKSCATECIELDLGLNTHEAECYGVLNAIIYAINNELKNVMIVNDNNSACQNKKILNFANSYNKKLV